MITVWGRPSSVNVQKVLWALEELAEPYHNEVVGGPHGGTDRPDFAALTPVRRVPVLEHGNTVLWESHAILRYLAANKGGEIAPSEQEWAVADQWMEYTTSSLQPPFVGVFWQLVRTLDAKRSEATLEHHTSQFYAALSSLESRLSKCDYLAGKIFSMADIAAGSLFFRAADLIQPFEGRPNLAAWYERLKARPAYRRVVMTSYEELRV